MPGFEVPPGPARARARVAAGTTVRCDPQSCDKKRACTRTHRTCKRAPVTALRHAPLAPQERIWSRWTRHSTRRARSRCLQRDVRPAQLLPLTPRLHKPPQPGAALYSPTSSFHLSRKFQATKLDRHVRGERLAAPVSPLLMCEASAACISRCCLTPLTQALAYFHIIKSFGGPATCDEAPSAKVSPRASCTCQRAPHAPRPC